MSKYTCLTQSPSVSRIYVPVYTYRYPVSVRRRVNLAYTSAVYDTMSYISYAYTAAIIYEPLMFQSGGIMQPGC